MLLRRVWPSRPAFESPFADFDQLRREMLRVFDTVAGNDVSRDLSAGVFPPMNVTQDDNSFYVRAEVPGIRAADLTVSALRNRVSISGKREIPEEHTRDGNGISYHRKERAQGEFSRTLTLPSEVAADKVEARYADGVLTLTLPKAEETKPRQITVRA
jgi:HSP20 family protein